jgi:spermidine synthase
MRDFSGVQPRRILDRSTTPDGTPLELAIEGGHHVLRVAGKALMSSATFGSEQEMARVAAAELGGRTGARVLIGGLGMGFTCRAALDAFGNDAAITVAEILPAVVAYNRGVLGPLADHPLRDPRVQVREADVADLLEAEAWDAVLLDVDNGPDAFTTAANASLYDDAGTRRLARALAPSGVVVVWSASPGPTFEGRLRRAGIDTRSLRVRARAGSARGARHTLFVGRA